MRILVFDTETTGIIPKRDGNEKPDISKYPYIVQISFIIYETQTKELVKSYDFIIDTAKYITIPDETINVHGITNEKSINEGVPIKKALQAFINELYCVSVIKLFSNKFFNTKFRLNLARS